MPLIRSGSDKPKAPDVGTAKDLRAQLKSGTQSERWQAARDIARTTENIDILAEALGTEGDTRVREALFTALARIATPESALAVVPFVRSDDSNIRTGAMDALRAMPAAMKPHLAGLLTDADPDVRILACDLVRVIPSADATALLSALLASEQDVNVCAAAVDVVAEVGGPEILPSLKLCAERFRSVPFLSFAVKLVIEQLSSQSAAARG